MRFRFRIRIALQLGVLWGFTAWIAGCGGSTGSFSGGTPTPVPTPPGHFVSISWQASTSSGVTTYNVYRSSTSGGPYTRVGWRVNSASFADTAVQPGATYFYVITAVTGSNVESVISGEVKSTVPSP